LVAAVVVEMMEQFNQLLEVQVVVLRTIEAAQQELQIKVTEAVIAPLRNILVAVAVLVVLVVTLAELLEALVALELLL
jgi:hypothetical protein